MRANTITWKAEAPWLAIILLAAFLVFSNALSGEFVYDDQRQIAGNVLIQNPSLYGKALVSDVWAFKGDGSITASNYWRPTFTAWCILNFQLFGLNPFGWHFLSIFLHMAVCALAYLLLRRFDISQLTAFSIALIFAVHPVHTESVAWISGSPDVLFGLFLLASFWFGRNVVEQPNRSRRSFNLGLCILFFLLALGAKEIAFFCFPIYFLIFSRPDSKKESSPRTLLKSPGVKKALPFVVSAVGYFFVRLAILGRVSQPAEDSARFVSSIITAPSIFVFYLRQIVFPFWVGPNYPLRPLESVDAIHFFFPLVLSLLAIYLIWGLATRSLVPTIGAAIFILPLISVFNISAFPSEQIVHDRYLYLSLLGFLMVVFPYLRELFEEFFGQHAEKVLLSVSVVVFAAFTIQTFYYNRVWQNDLALWNYAVMIDERSSFNWMQLGAELTERHQIADAIEAYNKSLEIKPNPLALMGRARNYIETGRFDQAVVDARQVIETPSDRINAYALYQSYETLAVALQESGKLSDAEGILRDARKRLPIYTAALTEKLAVVLYLQNRKPDALRELEAVKVQAKIEMLPDSKTVFLRLGMLYSELGNKEEAKKNLVEYLNFTTDAIRTDTLSDRAQAAELLRKL